MFPKNWKIFVHKILLKNKFFFSVCKIIKKLNKVDDKIFNEIDKFRNKINIKNIFNIFTINWLLKFLLLDLIKKAKHPINGSQILAGVW